MSKPCGMYIRPLYAFLSVRFAKLFYVITLFTILDACYLSSSINGSKVLHNYVTFFHTCF